MKLLLLILGTTLAARLTAYGFASFIPAPVASASIEERNGGYSLRVGNQVCGHYADRAAVERLAARNGYKLSD